MLCFIIEMQHFLKFTASRATNFQIIYKNSNFSNVISSNIKFELFI